MNGLILRTIVPALLLLSVAGCSNDAPDKGKGTQGCVADNECRAGRICESGSCVSVDENNGTNNANVMVNGETNNVVTNNNNNVGTNNVTIPPLNNETNNVVRPIGGCIAVTPVDEVDFGAATVGQARSQTVVVTNCHDSEDLVLSSVSACTFDDGPCAAGGAFTVDAMSIPTLPAVITPDESVNFVVAFQPTDLSTYDGQLTLKSSDPAAPELVMPLVGAGSDGSCPQAVARGQIAGQAQFSMDIQTVPLATIAFDGTTSSDPDGTVDRYEWELIQKPVNSTTSFTPSASVSDPTLFLDLAGEYIAELTVYDNDNQASCGPPARVHINAVPEEDVLIQLVWDTPTDVDQTDMQGTDLDLHFLHPNGSWNAVPYDIYWLNPTSDWGVPGDSDDPSLDIDDSDGAGPENLSFPNPEDGVTYHIGVYYYADNGYGPSYATVRVFIGGVMAYEYRDRYMPGIQAFWDAARLVWPSGAVNAINVEHQGFPTMP